ncbi:MAG: fumarylacetoacetase [Acidobacteriaceae bacterium]
MTLYQLNGTHDASRKSWVESANRQGCDFPLQNLPFGVFCPKSDWRSKVGIAIGDRVLDVSGCLLAGLFTGDAAIAAEACSKHIMNDLMSLGPQYWSALRARVFDLLTEGSSERATVERHLLSMADIEMRLPAQIGNYTDFYASLHHARHVGSLFRPANPLLPNYKYLPVAYHGRASSIVVDGTAVRRPHGQIRREENQPPEFAPTRQLDYEAELAFFVGPGQPLGEQIPIDMATKHLFGACLLNDWSARDIQSWEYQPLGPFLAKNFATSISPWVVTMEALAPFHVPTAQREPGDPPILPYLYSAEDREQGGLEVAIEVFITTAKMRQKALPPHRLSCGNFRDMYWSIAQMLTHHTSNGCNLQPGDLLGSGTISGPAKENRGCLLELTVRGQEPLPLPSAETRCFLEDGDEILLRGYCEREGFARIGFGCCQGSILAAK